jgi:hypothetical protein
VLRLADDVLETDDLESISACLERCGEAGAR